MRFSFPRWTSTSSGTARRRPILTYVGSDCRNASAGILAFDILVAECGDRRGEHIWCDDTEKPARLLIFDHDFALLESDGESRSVRFGGAIALGFILVCGHKLSPVCAGSIRPGCLTNGTIELAHCRDGMFE